MRFARWVASLRGWVYQPIIIALIVGSVILGLFATREFDKGHWSAGDRWLFGATVLCAALLYVMQMARDRGYASQLLDIRSKIRTDFGDALDAAVEEIGQLAVATRPKRGEIYGRALGLLLRAACELTGPGEGRMRASFFEHRPATPTAAEGLYVVMSTGREASTFDFLAGTAIGDEALRMVRNREYLLESDVHHAPPIHWTKDKPAVYNAFLSVSCAIKRAPIGMLSIDSTDATDINEDDVPMLVMIGRVISVAHRLNRR